MRAEHDVFDGDGNIIGWFKKDFMSSLLRSTWHLKYGDVEAVGQERNQTVAILRRVAASMAVALDALQSR
ncbi:MAG: hypothetical protein ACFCVC_06935 [Acidimicrobiia bacterium]